MNLRFIPMRSRKIIPIPALTFLFFLFGSRLLAQLPETDIWILDMSIQGQKVQVNHPVNVTHRPGYDNQPAFSPDGNYFLYTAIQKDNQSDIYRYDLKSGTSTPFTQTPTSEYSPTFTPDHKHISVVMVEKDSTQRLWQFPIKGGKASVLLDKIDSVGYHTWFMRNRIALWLLTDPGSLVMANLKGQDYHTIDSSIGRCFKEHNGILYFTHQNSTNGTFSLRAFHFVGWHIQDDLNIILPSQDFEFVGDQLLVGEGAKLFSIDLNSGVKQILIDLSTLGIKQISRISADPTGKKLAIVAE